MCNQNSAHTQRTGSLFLSSRDPCPFSRLLVTISALQGSGSPRKRVPREMHSIGQPKKLLGLSDSNWGGHQAFLDKGRPPAVIWHDLHKSKQGSLFRHTPSSPSLLSIRPPPSCTPKKLQTVGWRTDPESYHHSKKVWPHGREPTPHRII